MDILKEKSVFIPEEMPNFLASLWPRNKFSSSLLTNINDDDCAVMKWESSLLVATMDYINSHPIVVELGIGNYNTLGHLVVGSNLSDLCGTGAKPIAMLIGITMPYGSTTYEFKQIMNGIKEETELYGIPVIGGDSKLGKTLAIAGVALGSAETSENLFLKNGAEPGDMLWTSGYLGSCAAAVIGLKDGVNNLEWCAWAKNVLSVPNIPLEKSMAISKLKLGHGGTDISDGLGVNISNICEKSNIGITIYADKIPIAPEVNIISNMTGISPWAFSFASGGDFQFLVTTSPNAESKMKELGFHQIGLITKEKKRLITIANCGEYELPSVGHRDSRKLSFYEEILQLAREVDHV